MSSKSSFFPNFRNPFTKKALRKSPRIETDEELFDELEEEIAREKAEKSSLKEMISRMDADATKRKEEENRINTHNAKMLNGRFTPFDISNADFYIFLLHLFSFQTPILQDKKIRKSIKSIVGISPTMVLLFPLLFLYLKR
jgi:hypothetical protein